MPKFTPELDQAGKLAGKLFAAIMSFYEVLQKLNLLPKAEFECSLPSFATIGTYSFF